MDEILMTVSEAARALNKSAQTIRDWADRGKLPAIRMRNGQRLFTGENVERARQEQQRADSDEAA
jgi:excisionase family DNA binding protein